MKRGSTRTPIAKLACDEPPFVYQLLAGIQYLQSPAAQAAMAAKATQERPCRMGRRGQTGTECGSGVCMRECVVRVECVGVGAGCWGVDGVRIRCGCVFLFGTSVCMYVVLCFLQFFRVVVESDQKSTFVLIDPTFLINLRKMYHRVTRKLS